MRGYAVSNIAWPFADRIEIYRMMADANVTGLEIAPGMLFADLPDAFAPPVAIRRARLAEIEGAGLTLVSMQSLLFGVKDVAMFGTATQRAAYLGALKRAVHLASDLGIPHLVLGSPRERVIPADMPADEAERIAVDVLSELADFATAAGCRIGLEPNPAIYGTNFATHTDEAARIVAAANLPGLCLTLDIGNLHVNAEMPHIGHIIHRNLPFIGHVHLSEPHLAPAPADPDMAAQVISALSRSGYSGWISAEMRACGDGSRRMLRTALDGLNAARECAG